MVRYLGPKKKIINKFGNLPGLTQKVKREPQTQQENEQNEQKKSKASAYKIRLNEKQKLRYYYGVTEAQLIKYMKEARRRKGVTGFILIQLLEMRLDNIIFRLNLAPTIPAARQIINHGHVFINNKRVNIPSFQCKPGDNISFSTKNEIVKLLNSNFTNTSNVLLNLNSHLEFEPTKLICKVQDFVAEENLLFAFNDILVIEYYSRLI
ncbi:MAG: 30S ribosomal protein S4 [Sphaerochaetaceae bacterium]|nr:30S ribosomal protein S4 [Sphaerochaetaceae bacterium]